MASYACCHGTIVSCCGGPTAKVKSRAQVQVYVYACCFDLSDDALGERVDIGLEQPDVEVLNGAMQGNLRGGDEGSAAVMAIAK